MITIKYKIMSQKLRTIAAIVLLLTMAASCQKETVYDTATITSMETTYMVQYSIDGMCHRVKIESEEQWQELFYALLAKAESGSVVRVERLGNFQTVSAKETVTYSTYDKTDAYNWASNMMAQGYTVTVVYDHNTGLYNCTAEKK